MTEEQIQQMINRFLRWELPKNFNPDAGISYTPPNHSYYENNMPTGTNLLDYNQAEVMIRFIIQDIK